MLLALRTPLTQTHSLQTNKHRVKLLVAADATPFELFERVLTQDAWAARGGGGGVGGAHAAASPPGTRGAHSSSGGTPPHSTASSASSTSGGGDVLVDNDLGFAKDRTVSRLTEMQSLEYLAAHAEAHEPGLLLVRSRGGYAMAAGRGALAKRAAPSGVCCADAQCENAPHPKPTYTPAPSAGPQALQEALAKKRAAARPEAAAAAVGR